MDGQEPNSTQPQQTPPLNPDLMGYPTVEALVAAKRSSDQEAVRLRQRADQAESLAREVIQNMQVANPRQNVTDRSRPVDRLSELGIPADALGEFVRDAVREEFRPILGGLQARQTVLGRYPDYNKFEADVAAHIESDPSLRESYPKLFAADPVGAMEYALLKFSESRRSATPEDRRVAESAHGAIPGSRNGETRRQPQNGEDRILRAWENYQQNPNQQTARAYAQERLHTVIKDEFLNA